MTTTSAKNRTGFLKGVALLSSGSTVAQFIAVVGTLIASRLFTPEVFGISAFFSAFVAILSTIGCLRYEMAIVLPEKDEDAVNVFSLSVFTSFIFMGFLLVLLLFFNNEIARLFKMEEIQSVFWLIPIAALVMSLYNPLRFWFTRKERFGVNSARRVLTQTSVSGLVVGGGLAGFTSSIHLILYRFFGLFGGLFYLVYKFFTGYGKFAQEKVNFDKMIEMAKRYNRFPKFSIPEVLLSTFAFHAPVLVLTFIFTSSVVGKYNHAVVLVGIPIELVAVAISQVYYQKLASLKNEGHELAGFSEKVYTTTIKLVSYPAVILGFVAPAFLSLVIGKVWYDSGIYVAMLIPFMLLKFIAIPLTNIYLVEERQEVGLIFSIIQVIIQLGALIIGGYYGSATIAILSYSLSGTFLYLILCLLLMKMIGASYIRTLSLFLRSFSISVPFILGLALLKFVFNLSILVIVGYAVLSLAILFMLLLRYDKFLNVQFQNLLSKVRNRYSSS